MPLLEPWTGVYDCVYKHVILYVCLCECVCVFFIIIFSPLCIPLYLNIKKILWEICTNRIDYCIIVFLLHQWLSIWRLYEVHHISNVIIEWEIYMKGVIIKVTVQWILVNFQLSVNKTTTLSPPTGLPSFLWRRSSLRVAWIERWMLSTQSMRRTSRMTTGDWLSLRSQQQTQLMTSANLARVGWDCSEWWKWWWW